MSELPAIWNINRAKDLLCAPHRLLREEPWGGWVRQRGGISAVYGYLRALYLPERQRQTLTILLEHPGASVQTYVQLLSVERSIFFDYRKKLCEILVDYLNSWEAASQPEEPIRSTSPNKDRQQLSSLPLPETSFVGREQERSILSQLLGQPDVQLISLTGPGGIGKTRLALEVAASQLEHFEHGVHFVPLAPISDPALVLPTIAKVLGIDEQGDQLLSETLKERLDGRRLLLVLDNLEQILGAVQAIDRLLRDTPTIKVIATSRATLGLPQEQEYVVEPLALPNLQRLPGHAVLAKVPAIDLFIERTRSVEPSFVLTRENGPVIAEICVRLDGLPLAIELVAPRIKLLSPQEMLRRLNQRLRLATGKARGLSGRHAALQTTITWSYELLNREEQQLFAALSLFVGGATLEAVEAICADELELEVLDGIEALLMHSMIQVRSGSNGERRFQMLETMREYGFKRLEEAEHLVTLQNHFAAYYLQLAQRAEPELKGQNQIYWLDRLEDENDNLRLVLSTALAAQNIELALQLGSTLMRFWWRRGYIQEGRQQLEQALKADIAVSATLRAKALYAVGVLATHQGEDQTARTLLQQARDIFQAQESELELAQTLNHLAQIAWYSRDLEEANILMEEVLGIHRSSGSLWEVANSLSNLGNIALSQKDFKRSRNFFEESLALCREINDEQGIATAYVNLGVSFQEEGDLVKARSLLTKSVNLFTKIGNMENVANNQYNLGVVLFQQAQYDEAMDFFKEGLELTANLANKRYISYVFCGIAALQMKIQHRQQASLFFGAAESVCRNLGLSFPLIDQELYAQFISELRENLEFQDSWSRGVQMPLDNAIALALGL